MMSRGYLVSLLITLTVLFAQACGGGSSAPADSDSESWSGTKQLGVASAATYGRGVATDSSGNVFVAGDTTGSLYGNTLTGTQNFFVTKYDSSGTKQ